MSARSAASSSTKSTWGAGSAIFWSANMLTQNSFAVGSNGLAGGTDTAFCNQVEPLNGL